jgi:hypothetical protein
MAKLKTTSAQEISAQEISAQDPAATKLVSGLALCLDGERLLRVFRRLGLGFTDDTEPKRSAGSRHLTQVINKLRAKYPISTWVSPSGKQVAGCSLPSEVILACAHAKSKEKRPHQGLQLLDLAILIPDARPSSIAWLLASGYSPALFNPATGNTPIGSAAYRGHVSHLAVFRKLGVDMNLYLGQEHMPKNHEMVGTTLLHRVASRRKENENVDKVIIELLEAGLDPLAQTIHGRTVMDMADPESHAVISAWVAGKEHRALESKTPSRKPAPKSGPRL